jgi:hypothetical protein
VGQNLEERWNQTAEAIVIDRPSWDGLYKSTRSGGGQCDKKESLVLQFVVLLGYVAASIKARYLASFNISVELSALIGAVECSSHRGQERND